jgi:hypothetical protein
MNSFIINGFTVNPNNPHGIEVSGVQDGKELYMLFSADRRDGLELAQAHAWRLIPADPCFDCGCVSVRVDSLDRPACELCGTPREEPSRFTQRFSPVVGA